jgi:hypothetical protein
MGQKTVGSGGTCVLSISGFHEWKLPKQKIFDTSDKL